MHGSNTLKQLALAAAAAIVGLGGCGQREPPADVPAPQTPESAPPAAAVTADDAAPSGPAVAAGEPSLTAMQIAEPPHKLGVPADLRYQFDGDARSGQPATLHLAVVPRVAGSNLTVSVKKEPGLSTSAGDLVVQKVGGSNPYRLDIAVTKLEGGPSQLKVLVTMETPAGSAHAWYTIPFGGEPVAGKQHSANLE